MEIISYNRIIFADHFGKKRLMILPTLLLAKKRKDFCSGMKRAKKLQLIIKDDCVDYSLVMSLFILQK
jgi:hypothetical protein